MEESTCMRVFAQCYFLWSSGNHNGSAPVTVEADAANPQPALET